MRRTRYRTICDIYSDRVTCFKHTWETDLRLEIQNYNTITSQAQTELGNVGKPLIALFVARQ
jgi:hypothetical protein